VAPPALSFLGAFFTGVVAVPGVTFLVAAVPVVVAGLEALLTAGFPVEAAEAAVFFSGVAVDLAGVVVAAAGFVSPIAVRTGSFFCVPIGVLVFVAGVAVLVVFFTGGTVVVFDAADCVALAGVETVFFAAGVLPAVLATLLMLDCSAPVCFLRSATTSVILS